MTSRGFFVGENKTGILKYVVTERYNLYFYCLLYMISHVYEYYTGSFLKPLFLCSYLWTLALYLYHTFISRKYLSNRIYRNAQIFLVLNILTTFIYPENRRFSVLQDFAILIQYIFVFYSSFQSRDDQQMRGILEKVMHIGVVITFVVSLASLIAVYSGSSLVWAQENVTKYGRHRGFYFETNEAALYGYTSIMFSLYFLYKQNIRSVRENKILLLYMLNIPIQIFLIFMTGSRTNLLVLLFAVVCLFVHHARGIARNTMKTRTKWIAFLCLCVIFYILLFTKYGFNRNLYYYMNRYPEFWTGNWEEKAKIINRVSSGRYYLWESSIKEWLKSPWIGYGLKSGNFTYTVYKNKTNSHNLLINTLLFSGIFGLIALIRHFVLIYRNRKKMSAYPDFILWFFVSGFIIVSMLEVVLLYNGKAVSAICWAIMGFLVFI